MIEFDAASGGWLVTYSGTWWGIALRDYRPAAEAIRRKANGMPQLPGDDFLLSLAPHGHEHGPAYEEGKWTVA